MKCETLGLAYPRPRAAVRRDQFLVMNYGFWPPLPRHVPPDRRFGCDWHERRDSTHPLLHYSRENAPERTLPAKYTLGRPIPLPRHRQCAPAALSRFEHAPVVKVDDAGRGAHWPRCE
jgi:hypothetical protein